MGSFDSKGQPRTIQEFVRNVVHGPANLKIKIAEFAKLHSAHVEGLKREGMTDSDLISLLAPYLIGIFPECGTT